MAFRRHRSQVASGGDAEVDITDWDESEIQVTIHDVTVATSTITFTGMPAKTDEYQPIKDADGNALTVDLTDSDAARTFILKGNLSKVKAESATGAYTLLVGAL